MLIHGDLYGEVVSSDGGVQQLFIGINGDVQQLFIKVLIVVLTCVVASIDGNAQSFVC